MSVLCAETDERAAELARPMELTLLRFRQGRMSRFPSVAEATDYPYTPEERHIIALSRERFFAGSPKSVRKHVTTLADRAGVSEIMITTMTHDTRRPPPLLRIARRILFAASGNRRAARLIPLNQHLIRSVGNLSLSSYQVTVRDLQSRAVMQLTPFRGEAFPKRRG